MRKDRVLLISFHAYPSTEVGAKRPSETANYLSSLGYEVAVVSARSRDLDEEQGNGRLDEGVRSVKVKLPRKLITEIWRGFKRRRRARRAALPTAAGAQIAARPDGSLYNEQEGGGSKRGKSWLRRQYLAFEELFGANKLWLTFVCLRVLRLAAGHRYDLVIASGPPKAGYLAGLFAAMVFGAPLILDFRDPWYLHGDGERSPPPVGHPLAAFENYMGQVCVRRSASVVVASPGIERHLRAHFDVAGRTIELVRNGYDPSAVITSAPPVGRLSLLYAGTLYLNRNPFPLLEALHWLLRQPTTDRSKVSFTLIGQCEKWNGISVTDWVQERGLSANVIVRPGVSSAALRGVIEECNVLVNFAQGQQRQIPAKSYEYLASGRDVITVTEPDSDVAELFRGSPASYVVEPNAVAAMQTLLAGFYEQYVVRGSLPAQEDGAGASQFSRDLQLKKFASIVERTLA